MPEYTANGTRIFTEEEKREMIEELKTGLRVQKAKQWKGRYRWQYSNSNFGRGM
jgi:predicted ribosome quality control (RQC) complex YloA/Tae2 family protein